MFIQIILEIFIYQKETLNIWNTIKTVIIIIAIIILICLDILIVTRKIKAMIIVLMHQVLIGII
jgi:hypothetical protein